MLLDAALFATMSAWVRGATARYREAARRYPTLLFGVPFISSIVFAMSALATITRSRYDQHDHKLKTLNREEQLQLRRDRKKFDVREEYFVCCLLYTSPSPRDRG